MRFHVFAILFGARDDQGKGVSPLRYPPVAGSGPSGDRPGLANRRFPMNESP